MNRTLRSWGKAGILALILATGGCSGSAAPLGPGAAQDALIGSVAGLLSQPISGETVSEAAIGPEGGVLLIAGGHSIAFPPGAVTEPTAIRAARDPKLLRVEFSPQGVTFPEAAPPVLTFRNPRSEGLLGLVPSQLHIVHLTESGRVDEVLLGELDPRRQQVSARLRHFST